MRQNIAARGNAESERRILAAAEQHFAAQGLAGARTEEIATAAHANKAMLYYYFKSKSGLYAAAIEEVSGAVADRAFAALDPNTFCDRRWNAWKMPRHMVVGQENDCWLSRRPISILWQRIPTIRD